VVRGGGDVGVELAEGGEAVGAPGAVGLDPADGHLLFQGVDVDVVDFGGGFGGVLGGDPGDVAV